jgi:hypothetical protein
MSVKFGNYSRAIGRNWYQWRIFVDENDECLDKIEYVLYLLHQTFPNPARIVYGKKSRFALELSGRGTFTVFIRVKFKDGREEEVEYDLDLNENWPDLDRVAHPISDDAVGDLALALKEVKRLSAEMWQSTDRSSKFFTECGPQDHSERIVEILNGICEEMMKTSKKLSNTEMFILLASAYLHDIGMQYPKPELTLMELKSTHHMLSEEMILGSVKDPTTYRNLGVPDKYAVEIATVCRGHRETDLYGTRFNDLVKDNGLIRVRLLAALLSLAISLDITYKRVRIENLEGGLIPQETRVFWWRYYYVEDVSIQRGRIQLRLVFPSEEYEGHVVRSIEDQIDSKLVELRDILWKNDIRLFVGNHTIEYSKTKKPMKEEDLLFLKEEQKKEEKLRSCATELDIRGIMERTRLTAGVNAKYRRYLIVLDTFEDNSEVLKGTIHYSATVRNETEEVRELFQGGKVCDGETTIPLDLRANPPENPEIISSFERLEIDGRPTKFETKIRYLDPKDKTKGVRREVTCDRLIAPKTSVDYSFTEKILFDRIDHLSRRFWSVSYGIVEVQVRHPSTLVPEIEWSSRSTTDLLMDRHEVDSVFTIFVAEGKWMPGSGFLLYWRTK